MKVLEFLTKLHESDPRCFPSQYEEALRDEAERALTGVQAGPALLPWIVLIPVPDPVAVPTPSEARGRSFTLSLKLTIGLLSSGGLGCGCREHNV